ncbi:MAG TPA: hypothetical protein PKE45_15290, partial [Caldilineaceae bacterium]|nr:hypothetical protein [Caldilineaceae bacterium]
LPQLGSERRNDRPAGLVELSGSGVTFWGWLGGIILRLVLAVILTGVVVTLVALLHNIRPDLLRPVYATMRERTAFCFIIGVLVNLVLSILTTALFASILLCLGGFLTGAVLLGLNLVGWAVVSQYIGQRLMGYVQTPVRPLASTALGALLLTGVVALLWALGGCFQFFGFLLWLLASSVGVGAAVVRWLKLNGRPALPPPAMEELPPPPPPEGASPGGEPAAPFEAESAPAQAETNVLAELEGQQAQTPPPTSEFPSAEVTSPPTAEQPAVVEADFTVIRGIGPTFDRRLKSAGLK